MATSDGLPKDATWVAAVARTLVSLSVRQSAIFGPASVGRGCIWLNALMAQHFTSGLESVKALTNAGVMPGPMKARAREQGATRSSFPDTAFKSPGTAAGPTRLMETSMVSSLSEAIVRAWISSAMADSAREPRRPTANAAELRVDSSESFSMSFSIGKTASD